jgi:succinate-acetate transporter protein
MSTSTILSQPSESELQLTHSQVERSDSEPERTKQSTQDDHIDRDLLLLVQLITRSRSSLSSFPFSISTTSPLTNPSPIGLCGFALTTFVLSCFNAGLWISPTVSHGVVYGLALWYGGLAQLIAGFLEMRVGNSFGALAFISYGGFWMSLASLSVKSFDFLSALSASDLERALAIYLLAWTLFSFFMFLLTFRMNKVMSGLFGLLVITFAFLTAGKFQSSIVLQQIGGSFGIALALTAWYIAFAALAKDIYGIQLPIGQYNKLTKQADPSEKV